MAIRIKLPEGNLSRVPDEATRQAADYTASTASERVLYINLWFFKYGTHDRSHGAAVLFSLILLAIFVGVIFVGSSASNAAWFDKVFDWVAGAILFVIGVAIGQSGKDKN